MPKIALRMRLYPTEVQTHVLNQYFGACQLNFLMIGE